MSSGTSQGATLALVSSRNPRRLPAVGFDHQQQSSGQKAVAWGLMKSSVKMEECQRLSAIFAATTATLQNPPTNWRSLLDGLVLLWAIFTSLFYVLKFQPLVS